VYQGKKLKLHGFNNLTKSLSFNLYDVCYAGSESQRRRYIEYIPGSSVPIFSISPARTTNPRVPA